jgi:hypothetical protein
MVFVATGLGLVDHLSWATPRILDHQNTFFIGGNTL